jgi:hypothetical protein
MQTLIQTATVAATSVQTSPPAVPATTAVAAPEKQVATEAVAPVTSASQPLVPAIVDPPATDSEPPATTVSPTP